MEAFFSGAWHANIRRGDIATGGQVRRFNRAEVYIGGAWRNAASFVQPLTVSAPDARKGGIYGSSQSRIITANSTASPNGGMAPFTYVWTLLSGPFTMFNANLATVAFQATVPAEALVTGTARVAVTDALGNTAFKDIGISISNYSNSGGNL